ncbi:hypothetical protein GWK47_002621 [Chionoecetes opilio]|uniref:Uncharacterized protein n=1 Tax=Chionoecetes opilio TaxID=41210 RepID=A0A8J5BTS3_CHIOP|nr:hypothetical protein GWK47_002621 [Chionoecetes opilio]
MPANSTSPTPDEDHTDDNSCNEGEEGCVCVYEDIEDDEEEEEAEGDIETEHNEINTEGGDHEGKTRQKRFIFFTPDRRLSFPPGALLILTPTFSLPLRRYPPEIFSSAFRNSTSASMTISTPMVVKFDDLGLTSALNRFGILSLFRRRRRRRRRASAGGSLANDIVGAGGERPAMYAALETILSSVGLPGKACLLRATCEVFQGPLTRHGMLGELLHLFLSPSRSPSEHQVRLGPYVEAETRGRTTGDCSAYHAACAKSLFTVPEPVEEYVDVYLSAFS